MRNISCVLVLLLAACSASPPPGVPLQPPAPVLADWQPSHHLADTALKGGAYEMALQIVDQLLARNPRDAGALVRRGDALSALERPTDAAASYATALEIEPHDTRGLLGLGRTRLAQEPAVAEALFAKAMLLEPRNLAALSNLGVARDLQGHHAAAQDAYRMALGITPTSIPVQVNLGLSLALSGDPTGAVRLLQRVSANPADTRRAKDDLAFALTLGGRAREASALLAGEPDRPVAAARDVSDGAGRVP